MRPVPIVGHVPHIMWKGLLNAVADAGGNKGNIGRLVMGPKIAHVVSHPDHLRHIFGENGNNYIKGAPLSNLRLLLGDGLITSDGELWKRERNIVQVAFQRERVAALLALAARPTEEMLARWDQQPGTSLVPMHRELRRLVFILSGLTLFGCDLSNNLEEASAAFAESLGVITDRNENPYAPPMWIPTPGNIKLKRAIRILNGHVEKIIQRRGTEPYGNDVLSVLLRAQRESSEPINERQLRDEVITLYLAGHDATSHTLTWVLHFLALYPEMQQRLREESRQVLNGRAPTYDDLRNLVQTHMLINEVMRICPAVALLAREVVADDEVGGFPVKAGTWVLLSSYLTHHLSEFWPEPSRFDPERFSEEASRTRHPFAYFPFGLGKRICIGNHLATMEVQLMVAMILQRYEFAHPPGAKVTPVWRGTLHPKGGLHLIRRAL